MNAISKIAGIALASNPRTLADVVDQLGVVKGDIAASEAIEKALRDRLVDSGERVVSGQLYDATISPVSRETVPVADMKAYIGRTTAGRKWLAAHTQTTETTTVRVVARTAPREVNG